MSALRTRQIVYLALAGAGAVLPLAAILPWLTTNGLDARQFIAQLFANRPSAFFVLDVIVSAVVVLFSVAAIPDGLTRAQRLAVFLATLAVGVSLGLPLWLYFRERSQSGDTHATTSPGSTADSPPVEGGRARGETATARDQGKGRRPTSQLTQETQHQIDHQKLKCRRGEIPPRPPPQSP
jgi:hypothetical protein